MLRGCHSLLSCWTEPVATRLIQPGWIEELAFVSTLEQKHTGSMQKLDLPGLAEFTDNNQYSLRTRSMCSASLMLWAYPR